MSGCSHHVIQRGNNRQPCFFVDQDYIFYLHLLKESSKKYHVSIHAFVLMTNHVHLFVTPSDEIGVGRMMQSIGRCYVQRINYHHQRTGTLWEGRYKSVLVDSDQYCLILSRYIELNPVRASMVDNPSEYPWSSYQCNGLGKPIELLTPHDQYQALGCSMEERTKAYRHLFKGSIPRKAIDEI
jgi:putative transposase